MYEQVRCRCCLAGNTWAVKLVLAYVLSGNYHAPTLRQRLHHRCSSLIKKLDSFHACRYAQTQPMMDLLLAPEPFLLSERYASAVKTLGLGVFFMPVLPLSCIIALVGKHHSHVVLSAERDQTPNSSHAVATQFQELGVSVHLTWAPSPQEQHWRCARGSAARPAARALQTVPYTSAEPPSGCDSIVQLYTGIRKGLLCHAGPLAAALPSWH